MNCFIILATILLFLSKCLRAEESFERVEAVVGQSVELPCNITAENTNDKLNILAWYRKGSDTAFYSRDFRGDFESSLPPESRYRLVTSDSDTEVKLEIDSVNASDAGVYTCLADFAASPALKTHIELVIIVPPDHLWVVAENGTQAAKASPGVNTSQNIGPYYVGDTVHLTCVAMGGNPLASLSWWPEQRSVRQPLMQLSEQRVRSDLVYGPLLREDHGRVLTCVATNNEKTTPLSIDVIIDMYLPPDSVFLRSNSTGRVRAGKSLPLECHVIGARPLPPVTWKIGDNQLLKTKQEITMDPSQRLVVSEVQLTIDRQHDESQVTCCAPSNQHDGDGESFKCAQPLPLNVLYSPVLEIAVDSEVENNTVKVVKGSNISLACHHKANPSLNELFWIHKEGSRAEYSNDAIQSVLELTNVSEDEAGEYVCYASNDEGSEYSEPITIDVTYPAYCEDDKTIKYGLGEHETINITCKMKSNPEPITYRWVLVDEAVNVTDMKDHSYTVINTTEPTLLYTRPNGSAFSTIFCWGQNYIESEEVKSTPCTFLVTDETVPRPPTNCVARKSIINDIRNIMVTCEKGHDGGLLQQFMFFIRGTDADERLISVNLEPKFMIEEPTETEYKFLVLATNQKGRSETVEIDKDSVIDETKVKVQTSSVRNITTLALSLCGGVALVALAACGLVLCTYERASRLDLPREHTDPPLCAYNTDESNCETYHDSDDGSECNVKRTDSFRRAVSRHPSKNFDVRRTSSFHSARYMNDSTEQEQYKTPTPSRRGACRVHSLQNINRKRDMDTLCDHLVLHLPPETGYSSPKPMNTFYTMPRKMRHKLAKELSDEASEITQTSDGFSLPPPPDEFGSYRPGTRIKDIPSKPIPTYTTVMKNTSAVRNPAHQYNNPTTSMNAVGLPTISGHTGIYSYPDDNLGHQDALNITGVFQPYFTTRESGL